MNPFNTGSKIKDSRLFVGRIRETEEIFAKIRNGNCVSVVGERRIGKSSLLYHLCQNGPRVLGVPPQGLAYLDFLSADVRSLRRFVETLLESLHLTPDIVDMVRSPHLALTRALQRWNGPIAPIVFWDEFDKIRSMPELCNDDFLENLRSLCDSGKLCLVTASKENLKTICGKEGLTSPFWNIFSHLPLGEFTVDAHLDERELFLLQHWSDLQPTDTEMRFLVSYTSTHPLVMQIISFNLLQNRTFPRSDEALREKIARDTEAHFPGTADKIRQWLYVGSQQIPEKMEWTSAFLGRVLKNMNPLQDLIS